MPGKITTVIFDLSEVLLHGLAGIREELSRRLGAAPDTLTFQVPELQQLFKGAITEGQYWDALLRFHRWNITPDELQHLIRKGFKEIPGTRSIISDLKRNGYRIGLLSVHAREWIDFCESTFRYHDLFDEVCYSFELGICKPDGRAYQAILSRLVAQPEESLFVDDLQENLDAAASLGMPTIRFTTAQQLLNDLKDMEVHL